MTLTHPNSPSLDENIGDSISRIEENLEGIDDILSPNSNLYLHTTTITLTGLGAIDSGTTVISGIPFQPTSLICLASEPGTDCFSIGFSDGGRTDNCSIYKYDAEYGFGSGFLGLHTDATSTITGTITRFNTDGFDMYLTITGSPTGTATLIFLLSN